MSSYKLVITSITLNLLIKLYKVGIVLNLFSTLESP